MQDQHMSTQQKHFFSPFLDFFVDGRAPLESCHSECPGVIGLLQTVQSLTNRYSFSTTQSKYKIINLSYISLYIWLRAVIHMNLEVGCQSFHYNK